MENERAACYEKGETSPARAARVTTLKGVCQNTFRRDFSTWLRKTTLHATFTSNLKQKRRKTP